MDIKDTLFRIVRAARTAYSMSNALSSLGYEKTPYEDIFGDLADAICIMTGDEAETFCETVTYTVLHDDCIPDEHCVSVLLKMLLRSSGDIRTKTSEIFSETR